MSATLPDFAARERALALDRHVLAMAPAGSGKTGLLVARMLRALSSADEPEQVVAITFTNKAAAEIRNRVLGLLRKAQVTAPADAAPHEAQVLGFARDLLVHDARRGWQLLEHPQRLRAQTIDGFNAQLAAQLPLLSGLGGPMRVADDAWPLYVDAILRLFAELEDASLADADREAISRVLRLADNRIDRLLPALTDLLSRRDQWLGRVAQDDRHWEQAEAEVLQQLVMEGLHSFREALGSASCDPLMALLREGSTQSELLGWCGGLEHWPEPTVESHAWYRQLTSLIITKGGELRKTVNKNDGFVAKAAYTQQMKAWLESCQGDEQLAAAARAVRALPDPEFPLPLRQLQHALLRVMRRLAAHLRVVFGESGQTDFSQIAQSALAALRPDGGYGDALLAADRRIRHLLVDEMQDTSDAQIELLRQMTQDWQAGDGRSLFLVGDPQQSIYAFRKAEVRLFLQLWSERRIGSLPLECVQLRANFRSEPAVVQWFNAAFSAVFPSQADEVLGAVPFSASEPQCAAGEGGVSVAAFDAGEDERAAESAADAASHLVKSGSVAILARARAHLAPVIRALRARGQVPACQDIDPLASEPVVRDYIALARALWHPQDRLHWAVLLRAPFVGLSWRDLLVLSRGRTQRAWPERIIEALDDAALSDEGRLRLQRLVAALEQTGLDASVRGQLAERAEAIWHALGGPGCVSGAELSDLQSAMRLLRAHSRNGGIDDLEALQRGLGQLYAEARAGRIQVMTVHKAKGLEFDHVLLLGCNRKPRNEDRPLWHFKRTRHGEVLVPRPPDVLPADDPAHRLYNYLHELHVQERRNESLRLLYVAATRAKSTLALYVCAQTGEDGRPRFAAQSFAQLLAPVIADTFHVEPREVPEQPQTAAGPPRAPRLPLSYQYRAETGLYRPQESRTLRPSEGVLNAVEDRRESREVAAPAEPGTRYAQLVGTLYHQALERIAIDGLEAWRDGGHSRRPALASGFRRQGLPEPQVEQAVDRVLQLIGQTLASPTGRWLLSAKPWARNEYHIAGYRDGRWVAAVIDRCFTDEDGSLWLIDYKAAERPLGAEAVEAYVAQAVERYRKQLQTYADLLRVLRPAQRLRAALYFPEVDRLAEIPA